MPTNWTIWLKNIVFEKKRNDFWNKIPKKKRLNLFLRSKRLSQKNANYADIRKYYIKVKFYLTDNEQNKICENSDKSEQVLRNLRSKKLLRQPSTKKNYPKEEK
jgi:hypothetical protein